MNATKAAEVEEEASTEAHNSGPQEEEEEGEVRGHEGGEGLQRGALDDDDAPITSRTFAVNRDYNPADPSLDFFSEGFDAEAALRAEAVSLPYPKIKAMDNLAKLHYLLFQKEERDKHTAAKAAKAAKLASGQFRATCDRLHSVGDGAAVIQAPKPCNLLLLRLLLSFRHLFLGLFVLRTTTQRSRSTRRRTRCTAFSWRRSGPQRRERQASGLPRRLMPQQAMFFLKMEARMLLTLSADNRHGKKQRR